MDNETLFVIGYIAVVILIVEYIYWCIYIPNMRRLAQNDYRDL
jgi:hypothetical protein